MIIIEDADEATADADAKCISAKLTTSALKLLGYGFTNKGMNCNRTFLFRKFVRFYNHLGTLQMQEILMVQMVFAPVYGLKYITSKHFQVCSVDIEIFLMTIISFFHAILNRYRLYWIPYSWIPQPPPGIRKLPR